MEIKELFGEAIHSDELFKKIKRNKTISQGAIKVLNVRKSTRLSNVLLLCPDIQKPKKDLSLYFVGFLSIGLVITAYIIGNDLHLPQKTQAEIPISINYNKTLGIQKDQFLKNLEKAALNYGLFLADEDEVVNNMVLRKKLTPNLTVYAHLSEDDSIYEISIDETPFLFFKTYFAAVVKAENMSLSEDDVESITSALIESESNIRIIRDGRIYEVLNEGLLYRKFKILSE